MGDWEVEREMGRGEEKQLLAKARVQEKKKDCFIFGNSVRLGENWEQPEIKLR